jgi:hypothetical protein
LKKAEELPPPLLDAAPGGGASFNCGDNPPLLLLLLLLVPTEAALPLPVHFRLFGKGGKAAKTTTISRIAAAV